jgi:hypothetical protein
MSVFQDELGDDGSQYAHLQAAAAQQQLGSSVTASATGPLNQPAHSTPVSQ